MAGYKFDEGDRWPTGDPRGSSGLQALGFAGAFIFIFAVLGVATIGFPVAWLLLMMTVFRDIVGNLFDGNHLLGGICAIVLAVVIGLFLFFKVYELMIKFLRYIFG
jgi:hypothetical protein